MLRIPLRLPVVVAYTERPPYLLEINVTKPKRNSDVHNLTNVTVLLAGNWDVVTYGLVQLSPVGAGLLVLGWSA